MITLKNNRKAPVKVPVIMQMEALECGAACLDMILAYYGKWIPLEEVRSSCGVSRDGSNAKSILIAARSYGLSADGYRYEIDGLQESGSFPCIIFWNFNHFVVLRGFRKGKALLNDPARGEIAVSMEEFDESFTGICLEFEPTEGFETGGKPKSVMKFARERLRGTGPAVAFSLITTTIGMLIGVISPVFSRVYMDRLITRKNPEWVTRFFILYAVFLTIQLLVSYMSTRLSNLINGKMAASGNLSYFWKVLHLPMEFFSQRSSGDIHQRQATNAGIASTLIGQLAPLGIHLVTLIFYLVVMLRYSIPLSIVGISSVAFNMLIARMLTKKRVNRSRAMMRDSAQMSSTLVNSLEMIETIKASGAEAGTFQRWAGYQASVNHHTVESSRTNEFEGILLGLVSIVTNTVIQISGIWLIMRGSFTIGMLTAFQGYLSSFLSPASEFISVGQSVQEMRTEMERIEDVMQYPSDVLAETEEADEADDSKESYQKLGGSLEMKHVTFGYAKLRDPLIEDFSLSLKLGQSVAFVGRSGCGKSTLAKLISGLYQPWRGEILFDGKKPSEVSRNVFTGSVAVVDQDITLFEDTIANNIKMWDSSIEDFEMILAARDAQIHDDIMAREDGYQYVLHEGGSDFSGGQRQRLEIARVLAQDPTIVILDEATSALDAKTEAEVVKGITDRGITCIIIAHRLSTIRDCNEIIVLEQGKVVERGTHKELYQKDGVYRQLVSNE